jgi:hypothetical protein
MSTWTREEVFAVVGLAVGLVAALAAIFALEEGRTRSILIVLLGIIAVSSAVFVRSIGWFSGSERIAQAELEEEARRIVARETQRRREAIIEERVRVEAELRSLEDANLHAQDSLTRLEADREAQRLINREEAIKNARDRYYRSRAPALILGKWLDVSRGAAFPIEYTRDGRVVKAVAPDARYRFVTPDSIEETGAWDRRGPVGFSVLFASPDSFVIRSKQAGTLILRRAPEY